MAMEVLWHATGGQRDNLLAIHAAAWSVAQMGVSGTLDSVHYHNDIVVSSFTMHRPSATTQAAASLRYAPLGAEHKDVAFWVCPMT
eukprot:6383822-Amphidinium_carterae.2